MTIYLGHHARHPRLEPLRFWRRLRVIVPRQGRAVSPRSCRWARPPSADSPCLRCPRRVSLLPTKAALVVGCDWTEAVGVDEVMHPPSSFPHFTPTQPASMAREALSRSEVDYGLLLDRGILLAILSRSELGSAPADAPLIELVGGFPWVVSSDDNVGQAAALMRSRNCDCVAVSHGRSVVGVVFESDLQRLGLDPRPLPANESD